MTDEKPPERAMLEVTLRADAWVTIKRCKVVIKELSGKDYTRDQVVDLILSEPEKGIALLERVKNRDDIPIHSLDLPRGNRFCPGARPKGWIKRT